MESQKVLLMSKAEFATFSGQSASAVTTATKPGGQLADSVVDGRINILADSARTYAALKIIEQMVKR